ncbi:bifunctional Peptidase S26B/LexA-Signal peptidase-like superfamily/Peptidase S26/Peptidase S24-S26A-S26B-S26C/Signal peptidase Sec11/Peptidase S26A [Babesia duncani]|uniref:Signal peptidase complex catalytic subunit SEC11 n=1 Tax=Babesia duncani TaxID=323732 RepID=A0AAD9PJ81_9APIC|nr:bifunctional Peptidase S26B/LexA-Signal peptidase-like superfamily/Peptidase S26/Peptidase S24-S26A-S26B-S26C/Signal peptidase Sec11/Peptidase S26A [Babesia duncani]
MDAIVKEYQKAKKEVKEFLKNPRDNIEYFLGLLAVVATALMCWKAGMLVTGTDSPIVVVLSGSMEPGFYRGDILFLAKTETVSAGSIIVFKLEGRDIPIVHRIISLHEAEDGQLNILTKGDNNMVNDRSLYPRGQNWLSKKHIVGTVLLRMPMFGLFTIFLNEYPAIKWAIVSILMYMILNGKG